MNAESNRELVLSKRAMQLASIGLLAGVVFGLAKLGLSAVPVWILAVPFVLLAVMDLERCFAHAGTLARRVGAVAFHFVIVATVFAAHSQIGAGGAGGTASTGGCGSGNCGSASGSSACGCGSKSKSGASSAAMGSACGCGSKSAPAAKSAGPTNATQRPTVTANVNRPTQPRTISAERLPAPGTPLGPKLGAGMSGIVPRDPAAGTPGAVVPLAPRAGAPLVPAASLPGAPSAPEVPRATAPAPVAKAPPAAPQPIPSPSSQPANN